MNAKLLKYAIAFWLVDAVFAFLNFMILMNLIYEPILGELPAHRIGMMTRIALIFILSFFLLRMVKEYETVDLLQVGVFWLILELLLEWGGSLLMGRPVEEILVGWNLLDGHIWILVLLAYLIGPYIVGKHIIEVYMNPNKN
ncbi:MAG: hypothetical protein ACFFD4_32910 [Candidatus Odinarchaeota archaeon]